MSDCTLMFSNTSFELSTCFPHIAESTRTMQQINNYRSTNLKKLTRRRMIKSLRFERKITLLGATTLKIAKSILFKQCVGCGTNRSTLTSMLCRLGATRGGLSEIDWTWDHAEQWVNISELYHQCFFAKGEYWIKQLTRCYLHVDLLTRQSCWEELLKHVVAAVAAWIHSSYMLSAWLFLPRS